MSPGALGGLWLVATFFCVLFLWFDKRIYHQRIPHIQIPPEVFFGVIFLGSKYLRSWCLDVQIGSILAKKNPVIIAT